MLTIRGSLQTPSHPPYKADTSVAPSTKDLHTPHETHVHILTYVTYHPLPSHSNTPHTLPPLHLFYILPVVSHPYVTTHPSLIHVERQSLYVAVDGSYVHLEHTSPNDEYNTLSLTSLAKCIKRALLYRFLSYPSLHSPRIYHQSTSSHYPLTHPPIHPSTHPQNYDFTVFEYVRDVPCSRYTQPFRLRTISFVQKPVRKN